MSSSWSLSSRSPSPADDIFHDAEEGSREEDEVHRADEQGEDGPGLHEDPVQDDMSSVVDKVNRIASNLNYRMREVIKEGREINQSFDRQLDRFARIKKGEDEAGVHSKPENDNSPKPALNLDPTSPAEEGEDDLPPTHDREKLVALVKTTVTFLHQRLRKNDHLADEIVGLRLLWENVQVLLGICERLNYDEVLDSVEEARKIEGWMESGGIHGNGVGTMGVKDLEGP